ncbi:HK97 family phage prohead protease [Staphylococcus aureus]|nr:HK97 family phage prohead protease [Staphylococcus aureus]
MSKETRVGNIIEVRSNDNNEMVIEGYALKFDTWSENLGGFRRNDFTSRFQKTLIYLMYVVSVDHIPSQIIGRTKSGTLELETDDVGLKYRCKLPNTTFARDLYENMRVGNINQCSFGFMLDDKGDEVRFDEQENIYKRTLTAIRELTDVSVVTYPAYKDTDVKPALRHIETVKKEQRKKELEIRLKKHSILNNIW